MTYVRFEDHKDGRMSKDYGPFEYVNLDRTALRGYVRRGPGELLGELLLAWQPTVFSDWRCPMEAEAAYSDIVIFQKED